MSEEFEELPEFEISLNIESDLANLKKREEIIVNDICEMQTVQNFQGQMALALNKYVTGMKQYEINTARVTTKKKKKKV